MSNRKPVSRTVVKHRGPIPNTIKDFWNKVAKGRSNECWNYLGGADWDGYGAFWYGNKQYRAHRFVAEFVMRLEIAGKVVCHRCDTPGCVNPKHLFVGTPADNSADRNSKGRQVRGERCHTARLSPKQVLEVRKMLSKGVRRRLIKDKFNVSTSCIAFIAQSKSWKHI